MRFTKMEGTGNDYLYVNLFEEHVEDAKALAVRLSDRHFGVGSDGLVLIGPSDRADLRMIMYNADGSRGKMCGNASRCIGKYAYERGLVRREEMTLETDAGIKTLHLHLQGDTVEAVTVNMGAPIFVPEKIPCLAGGYRDTILLEALGRTFEATPLSMGNPHAVILLDEDVETFDLAGYGEALCHNPVFPEEANIEFLNVLSEVSIRMRVYERGTGITLACGTGACAAAVAAMVRGRCKSSVQMILDGGILEIDWYGGDVLMKGPARFICDGVVP